MLISTLDIIGSRGFAQEQTLHFAQPNGAVGSALTLIVGPNNGGKSTLSEAYLTKNMRSVLNLKPIQKVSSMIFANTFNPSPLTSCIHYMMSHNH